MSVLYLIILLIEECDDAFHFPLANKLFYLAYIVVLVILIVVVLVIY